MQGLCRRLLRYWTRDHGWGHDGRSRRGHRCHSDGGWRKARQEYLLHICGHGVLRGSNGLMLALVNSRQPRLTGLQFREAEDTEMRTMGDAQTRQASAALTLLKRATKGALGTLRATDGHPYTSLVLVAMDKAGRPVFLISRLALHTQNLLANAKASLLIDGTDAAGDAVAGGRVTFVGSVHATEDIDARACFLAKHPSAQTYASFADFGVYVMAIESAHLIEGFGRIVDIASQALADACAGMSHWSG